MTQTEQVIITIAAISATMAVAVLVIWIILECSFRREVKKRIKEARERFPELFDSSKRTEK